MSGSLDKYIHCFLIETEIHGEKFLPGWYFTDEAYYYHGPFGERDEAVDAFRLYVEMLECPTPKM